MSQRTKLHRHCVERAQHKKRSTFVHLFRFPISLLSVVIFLLLVHYFDLAIPVNSLLGQNVHGNSVKKRTSLPMHAVKEETPSAISRTHLPSLKNSTIPVIPQGHLKPGDLTKRVDVGRVLGKRSQSKLFSRKVSLFYEKFGCKVRFFMTWISSVESFGDREFLAIQSLFKTHPDACLVIVSNSMDSKRGSLVINPFLDKGFRVLATKPDFHFLFKGTAAELWMKRLKRGDVDPGEIPLGQNISNLLRLCLLYKFGGIYLDTDVIVLKSFKKLRNVIGAQAINVETRNWTRLNNAVLIFDKNHPLLRNFIHEFALTFDGNKWGHNGPYLVSRVAAKVVKERRRYSNVTILPPSAFYPVTWSKIGSLFEGPKGELQSKWLRYKLHQIEEESYALHLWNKQSKGLRVENGSIIDRIRMDYCIFCNPTSSRFVQPKQKQ